MRWISLLCKADLRNDQSVNQRNVFRLVCGILRPHAYLFAMLSVLLLSCHLPAQQRKNVLRPIELIENATNFLNRSVEVDILEPLWGPLRPEDLARAEYGKVEVRIPEGMSGRVSLVPEAFKINDPNRYRHKFNQVLESPLRVRGEFLKDDELSNSERRPVYVIRVSSIRIRVVSLLSSSQISRIPELLRDQFPTADKKIRSISSVTLNFYSRNRRKARNIHALWFVPELLMAAPVWLPQSLALPASADCSWHHSASSPPC